MNTNYLENLYIECTSSERKSTVKVEWLFIKSLIVIGHADHYWTLHNFAKINDDDDTSSIREYMIRFNEWKQSRMKIIVNIIPLYKFYGERWKLFTGIQNTNILKGRNNHHKTKSNTIASAQKQIYFLSFVHYNKILVTPDAYPDSVGSMSGTIWIFIQLDFSEMMQL